MFDTMYEQKSEVLGNALRLEVVVMENSDPVNTQRMRSISNKYIPVKRCETFPAYNKRKRAASKRVCIKRFIISCSFSEPQHPK